MATKKGSGTGKLKDIKDFENMRITVHHVNADKVLKKEINTNLLNLVTQTLHAWVNDQDEEAKRLEKLAVEEILKVNPDMNRAQALVWMVTTLGMFQKKQWVPKT
jgi:hypothetical protein